jgi:hypothetical protein
MVRPAKRRHLTGVAQCAGAKGHRNLAFQTILSAAKTESTVKIHHPHLDILFPAESIEMTPRFAEAVWQIYQRRNCEAYSKHRDAGWPPCCSECGCVAEAKLISEPPHPKDLGATAVALYWLSGHNPIDAMPIALI